MENTGRIAIVFFSRNGNSRLGATLLQRKLGGRIVELREEKKGNFIQAIFKRGSLLAGRPWVEVADAEHVYLLSPIWASSAVPAMNTFLKNADFTGKAVTVITFQQFSDLRNSAAVHDSIAAQVTAKGGKVIARYALLGGKMGHLAPESQIAEQIGKVVP